VKITKLIHSCLLVEMPAPVNRTALFDPGVMSESVLDVDSLQYLDNVIITHNHPDHMSIPLIKKLVAKFPNARITTTPEVVEQLQAEGITASSEPPAGIEFFDAPHEKIHAPAPQQIGVHYLGLLSDPGDSHSFHETKRILALPVTAPWGSNYQAVELAIELKPQYIIPIHDWHWSDEAREMAYDSMEKAFSEQGITFFKPVTGEPFVIDVA